MNVFETVLERRLLKRLAEVHELRNDQLLDGKGITEFHQYRESVGYLRALKDVALIIKEVSDDLNKEERPNAS